MKKLIVLLLVFTMMFTLFSCKSADEEQEAMIGDFVTDNTEEDVTNSDGTSDDNLSDDTTPSGNENTSDDTKDDVTNSDSSSDDSLSDDTTPSGNDNASDDTKNDVTNSDSSSDDTPTDDTTPSGNENTSDDTQDDKKPVPGVNKYTVTFDYGYDNKTQTEKTDGKLTEIKPTRDGYTFEGWFDGKDKWDFSKAVTSELLLKAKWKIINYTITLNTGEATLEKSIPTTYTVEDHINLGTAIKKGKMFVSWEIKTSDKTYGADSISKGTTGDLTLTPIWDEKLLVLGKYERDNITDNGKEDIVWLKLKEENGKALFITKEIIDAKPFDTVGGAAINWSNCTLRNWLSGHFYKTAFSKEEKEAIIETTVTTIDDTNTYTSKDYVFLLSKQEVLDVMKTYSPRYADVTAYAMANGAIKGQKGGWWWLRNKTSITGAALCDDVGIFNTVTGYSTKLNTVGVRPCIWIDMSKIK